MRRKFHQFNAFKILSALVLFFCFAPFSFAQTDAELLASLPQDAMRQIVPRILKWYFKPRSAPKQIRLAARGIKREWLPEIRNIEFVLVSDEELGQTGNVFFFKYYEPVKDRYEIGFAYGEPDCSSTGDIWYFRVSERKVRLWRPENMGFGSGCGSGEDYGPPN